MRNKSEREWYRCTECNRVVIDWGRTGHWQRHNPNHPHSSCCPVPRGEVDSLFILAGVGATFAGGRAL